MKKIVVLVVLMAGLSVMAQRSGHDRGDRGSMKDISPEQMATLQTKQMTLALDLNDAQQKQIHSLNLENALKRAEKRNEMKAKKESGEAKKLTADERYAMKTAMLDHQIAQKEKVKKILNKEQYDKWETLKMEREGHRRDKGRQRHKERAEGK